MVDSFNHTDFLRSATNDPGVYCMYDAKDVVIYVGKAKQLKKRISSYFQKNLLSEKTRLLVQHISNIKVTVTCTEKEAFLLEQNYIKKYLPKYNVLLRDDKYYPYFFISAHPYPRISISHGNREKRGEYFGPYPDLSAAKDVLSLVQKIFPVRQCEDSVYKNRTRPCLMYQIGRCSGPCVSAISRPAYQELVSCLRLFLQGEDQKVIARLVDKMDHFSKMLNFERAAIYRDQIRAVRHIQERQCVSDNSDDNIDAIGFALNSGLACIHTLMIRQGKVLGSRSFYPKVPCQISKEEIFESFLKQHYISPPTLRIIPDQIVFNETILRETSALRRLLSDLSGHKVTFYSGSSGGAKSRYLELANTNAMTAIKMKVRSRAVCLQRFIALRDLLGLEEINRVECFDVSHTMGEATVASCVVFNKEGPLKQEYRRYSIDGITKGDDYTAMSKAVEKRYSKQQDFDKIPEAIFVDGGKGQLSCAYRSIQRYWHKWPRQPLIIGIAKGINRKPGLETLLRLEGSSIHTEINSPALHLVRYIRDESHSHAISGHRAKRGKRYRTGALESVTGIGPKRRKALLNFMGGLQKIKQASIEEITQVPGISVTLAEKIHQELKPQ